MRNRGRPIGSVHVVGPSFRTRGHAGGVDWTGAENGGSTVPSEAEEEEEPVCPLCIEVLDETEIRFKPCPCGYQICLFCYERIKLELKSLCPSCRKEYGSPQEASPTRLQARSTSRSASPHPQGRNSSASRGGSPHPPRMTPAAAPPVAAAVPAPPPPVQVPPTTKKPAAGVTASTASISALPVTSGGSPRVAWSTPSATPPVPSQTPKSAWGATPTVSAPPASAVTLTTPPASKPSEVKSPPKSEDNLRVRQNSGDAAVQSLWASSSNGIGAESAWGGTSKPSSTASSSVLNSTAFPSLSVAASRSVPATTSGSSYNPISAFGTIGPIGSTSSRYQSEGWSAEAMQKASAMVAAARLAQAQAQAQAQAHLLQTQLTSALQSGQLGQLSASQVAQLTQALSQGQLAQLSPLQLTQLSQAVQAARQQRLSQVAAGQVAAGQGQLSQSQLAMLSQAHLAQAQLMQEAMLSYGGGRQKEMPGGKAPGGQRKGGGASASSTGGSSGRGSDVMDMSPMLQAVRQCESGAETSGEVLPANPWQAPPLYSQSSFRRPPPQTSVPTPGPPSSSWPSTSTPTTRAATPSESSRPDADSGWNPLSSPIAPLAKEEMPTGSTTSPPPGFAPPGFPYRPPDLSSANGPSKPAAKPYRPPLGPPGEGGNGNGSWGAGGDVPVPVKNGMHPREVGLIGDTSWKQGESIGLQFVEGSSKAVGDKGARSKGALDCPVCGSYSASSDGELKEHVDMCQALPSWLRQI